MAQSWADTFTYGLTAMYVPSFPVPCTEPRNSNDDVYCRAIPTARVAYDDDHDDASGGGGDDDYQDDLGGAERHSRGSAGRCWRGHLARGLQGCPPQHG